MVVGNAGRKIKIKKNRIGYHTSFTHLKVWGKKSKQNQGWETSANARVRSGEQGMGTRGKKKTMPLCLPPRWWWNRLPVA